MRLSILLLLFLIGCGTEPREQYSAGIPIEHANELITTKQSFGSFNLHTWAHDTLYRHSGQELLIEPADSALEVAAYVQGAQIIYYSNNDYRFVLEPSDSIVILTLILNSTDTITKEFVSPHLPSPSLTKQNIGDSVCLTLNQQNERLQKLLPYDNRYGFETPSGMKDTLIVPKNDLELNSLKGVRMNYRNNIYPVKIKK